MKQKLRFWQAFSGMLVALLLIYIAYTYFAGRVSYDAFVIPLPQGGIGPAYGLTNTPFADNESKSDKEVVSEKVCLDVPYLSQEDVLPNGCEAASAIMLLRAQGVDVTVEQFLSEFLPQQPVIVQNRKRYGPDPAQAYAGDPTSETGGWGCYAPVITKALGEAVNDPSRALDLTGCPLESLCQDYIDAGIPVAVWATVGMEPVTKLDQWYAYESGESIFYPNTEHCLVLVGYDGENYYFNDPYESKGLTAYPKGIVRQRYHDLGMQAAVLLPADVSAE